ncbi:p450 domain containing protein [Asbolus verrucosus]|uniref:p450 domain containing protein n=1 Tax=Asbolus verrucosus TaxID=1661398 RepID=A0A482V8T2_ASBVE|nr:p450 domain containing protein [Asbolus verrucosus]
MNVKSDPSFTDDQLMSLCLDLFMAGSETTSNTLGFSVVYMLEYPEVQKKVQDEMDEIVGRNRWPALQDRIKLKYTEAVLMEIQRRANIPPLGIAHRATRATSLFGYFIPKGTIVLTSLYSVHMDEKFWKDPSAFRPERFLDECGNLIVNEKYFAPFGYDYDGPLPQLEGFDGVTISPKPFKAKLIPRID